MKPAGNIKRNYAVYPTDSTKDIFAVQIYLGRYFTLATTFISQKCRQLFDREKKIHFYTPLIYVFFILSDKKLTMTENIPVI